MCGSILSEMLDCLGYSNESVTSDTESVSAVLKMDVFGMEGDEE